LIRFVVDPSGVVVPDLAAKLPGRGMWVRASLEAVETAIKKGHFARAAKAQVKAPADLGAVVEAALLARIKGTLGLAARAGDLVTGFEKAREALRGGAVRILVEAADGAADGRDKVFARAHGLDTQVLVLGVFPGRDLDLALGRSNVIHAAVRPGSLAKKLGSDMGRLKGFRPLAPEEWRLPGGNKEAAPAAELQSGAA
jgi:predicted RNA-binding protein YlxR (DUF448 family)